MTIFDYISFLTVAECKSITAAGRQAASDKICCEPQPV